MLPPALAFAWLLWRQHRNGLLALLSYLFCASILSALIPAYCSPGTIESLLGGLLVISLSAIPVFLLGVFAYGFDGADVVARESCFPPRLFRLAVPTYSLVIWPTMYGASAAILLWLVIACFVLRPWVVSLGGEVPLWWPAPFMAAILAWVQALLWMPFGLRWLRVILFLVLTPLLIVLAAFSSTSGVSEYWLITLHTGLALIGWTLGYVGVARARCGQVSDWQMVVEPVRKLLRWMPRSRTPFSSTARAQVWFEWRRIGYSLMVSTGLTLIVVLWPLLLGKNDVLPATQTLLHALMVPVLLAGFSGAWPGTDKNHWTKDRAGMMPFIAMLPMTCADMVGAMLVTAAWSTLAAWAVIIVMVPLAVVLTGSFQEVAEGWQQLVRHHTPGEIAVGIVAIGTWLFVCTWKRKVDSLYLGLTGRTWITGAILWAMLGYIPLIFAVKAIYDRPEIHETFFAELPWLLALLILARLSLALWALRQVMRQRLVQPITVARWLAAWLLLASALFAALAWVVPTERVPVYYLAFAVLFAMPMARLTLAPLALAWNRHR